MKTLLLIVSSLLSATILTGCGSDKISVVPVTGAVTFNGEPLGEALVTFLPDEGSTSNRGASATTAADGTFSLVTLAASREGAMLGTYIVLIKKSVAGEWKPNTPAPEFHLLTPEKYDKRETTPLKFTVTKGTNKANFDIVP